MSGCAPLPLLEDPESARRLDLLTADIVVEEPGDVILKLSEPVKAELDNRISTGWSSTRRVKQLSEFFFSESERNIQYDAWFTKSATETFLTGRGNCLSMSSLFVAAARYLGVDAKFKTVAVRPTWAQSDEVMIRYEHIVAAGDVTRGEYVVDFLPEVFDKIGQQQTITDEQALALYYSNMSVEALISGDTGQGIIRNLQAIKLWPDNANVWSNLGSAYRRDGQYELAELSFKRALLLDRNNYSALSNLTHLFVSQNRQEEADRYLSTVSRYYRRNPYYHYHLAQMQISRGNFTNAEKNLHRASEIRHDDPALLDAISMAFAAINDMDSSNKQAQRAKRLRQKQLLQRRREQSLIRPNPVVW